ncbi:MAG: hypothetical protein OXC83_08980 [Chloroflexi bacterium]|nr:hypothetical protein [Chloroflexota bacterium]
MNDNSSPDIALPVPSIPRYIIGIIVGVVSVILGAFILTEPTWLRILILVLGVIQLIVSAFHTRQVIRYFSSR